MPRRLALARTRLHAFPIDCRPLPLRRVILYPFSSDLANLAAKSVYGRTGSLSSERGKEWADERRGVWDVVDVDGSGDWSGVCGGPDEAVGRVPDGVGATNGELSGMSKED
jgi:hypothetical protein